jgi:hypothetical protein
MSESVESKKYKQGIEDAEDGFPPNRFMRNDVEYMNGYNSINKEED